MNVLPPELFDAVVEACDHASLKTFRLVNHQGKSAADPLVFSHFWMGLYDCGLQKLMHLAKSPLSKYVTKFTMFTDRLPHWERAQWESEISIPLLFDVWCKAEAGRRHQDCVECSQSPGSSCCGDKRQLQCDLGREFEQFSRDWVRTTDLDAAWTYYHDLAEQQGQWLSGVQGLALKEHFAMLPNVDEVELTFDEPPSRYRNDRSVWEARTKRTLLSIDGRNLRSQNGSGSLAASARAAVLQAIGFRAQFAGTKHVTILRIDAKHNSSMPSIMGQGFGRRYDAHILRYQGRVQNSEEAFRHLKTLRLCLHDFQHTTRGGSDPSTIDLARLAAQAKQLEHLEVTFFDSSTKSSENVPPAESFFAMISPHIEDALSQDDFPWTQLRTLEFTNATVYAEHLLDLLRRCANTLRSLRLRNMTVVDAPKFLAHVPHTAKLDLVYFENIWCYDVDSPGGSELRAYFSKGTNQVDDYHRAIKAYLLGHKTDLPTLVFGD